MAPASIVKIAFAASVLAAGSGAALVVGLQREANVETSSVAAMMSASPPAANVRNEQPPAPAAAETQATNATAATNAPAETKATEETKAKKDTKQATAADLTAELAGQADIAAADQSAPSFDLVRIEETGEAVIAGRAAPGATVELLRNGERVDQTVADASGDFVMVSRLPAGSYELSLSEKLPDGSLASSKKGVMVALNSASAGSGATQSRAEYMPERAPQALPLSQSPMQASKPQQTAALKPAPINSGNSEESASSPAVGLRHATRVVRGDSLWRISRITYGDGARYAVVYQANRDRIHNPNLIHPGQILVLPIKHH